MNDRLRHLLLLSGFLALLTVFGTGCPSGPTDLTVQVCGDFSVPGDIQGLRVEIHDADRQRLHSTYRDLLECPADRIHPLPQSVTFLNVHSDAALVLVSVLEDDVVVARTERRIDELGQMTISLPQSCRGVQCTLGQACVDGECRWTPTGSDSSCLPAPAQDAGFTDTTAPEPDVADSPDAGEPVDLPRYCPVDES